MDQQPNHALPGPRHLARTTCDIRVVIYGRHSDDWMAALGPGAPVWRYLPRVAEIVEVADAGAAATLASCRGHQRTVIIPLLENHIRTCPPNAHALIAPPAIIDLLASKSAFAAHLEAHNLAALAPLRFQTAAHAQFPCVIKRTNLNAGQGVAIADDRAKLDRLLQQEMWRGQDVVLQEWIPGDTECVTHCLCKDGRILWHASFAYPMGDQPVVRCPANSRQIHSVRTPAAALAAFEAILRPLAYTGPCNIDHKILPNGQIKIFEINPRLGGSLLRPATTRHLAALLSCLLDTALTGAPSRSASVWAYRLRSWIECRKDELMLKRAQRAAKALRTRPPAR